METEAARRSLDRLSVDTSTNINEDVTLGSEFSSDSRQKQTESIFSSLRTSIDGNSGYINNFNILRQGPGEENEVGTSSSNILGPNSIFDLTQALDAAKIKLNKALRSQVTVNAGAQTVYNLNKPSTRDIPPIKLQPLKKKVSTDVFSGELINGVRQEYTAFEQSYNPLTADVLSSFAELYQDHDKPGSQAEPLDESDSLVIPEVFEDANFRLDDPRVFRQVMQQSKILQESDSSNTTQLVHNPEVQENLLRYLDAVEVRLISEISKTSDSFFITLGDIRNIKSQSQTCVEKLEIIKSKLRLLEISQSRAGLEILNTLDESRSVNHLETSLTQLKEILRGIDEAQRELKDSNNIECLRMIVRTENLIDGVELEDIADADTISDYPKYEHSLVKLTNLPALQTKIRQLHELKELCIRGYVSEFLSLLVENLRSHYTSVAPKDTMNRMYSTSFGEKRNRQASLNRSYMAIDTKTKGALQLFIRNLLNSGFLSEAFGQYRVSIVSEVKTIIRYGLPMEPNPSQTRKSNPIPVESQGSSNTSEIDISHAQETKINPGLTETQRGTLSENIRTLGDTAFSEMMKVIYSQLSECLRRLTIHQKLLLDLSLTSLPRDLQKVDVMSLDITDAINKAIEITQVRLVKILNVRLEQLGDLPLNEYLSLFLMTLAYLLECESINPGFNSSDLGRSLNDWTRNHIGYFLHRFHSSSVKKLAKVCDKETWKEYTGPELLTTQLTLNRIISYSEFVNTGEGFDGSEWQKNMLDISEGEIGASSEDKSLEEASMSLGSNLRLKVKDTSYYVPSLITVVMEATQDYVILSKIFGSKASLIKQNLVTFLRVLNSRISLAILNAGATRTAGLKHITTKHLALCIQTVEFLRSYSEILQGIFQPTSDERELSQDEPDQPTFATSINHFNDHKLELVNKLVSIMHERTLSHCGTIKSLKLSEADNYSRQCRPYMETLVKETMTVHKVIGKYLSLSDCSLIMLRIFDNYKKILVNCFCTELPQLQDLNEKHSLLKDVDFFREKLGEIDGYGNSGQVIWENVNSLPTVEDMKMEEKMRHNIEKEKSDYVNEAGTEEKSIERNHADDVETETELDTSSPGRQSIEIETTEKELSSADEEKEATEETKIQI